MVTEVAVPPSKTVSLPSLLTVVLLAVPPLETVRLPPPLTVVLLAVPPLETVRLPPPLTVVLLAVPPLETYMEAKFSSTIPVLVSPSRTLYILCSFVAVIFLSDAGKF